MARARDANGQQQTAKTSCRLGYKRYEKKAWKTTKELDRNHTTKFDKHWHDLVSGIWKTIFQGIHVSRLQRKTR